jgi:hypothetical protein
MFFLAFLLIAWVLMLVAARHHLRTPRSRASVIGRHGRSMMQSDEG